MKNTYKKITLLILLFGLIITVKAQSVSLSYASLLSAPLNTVENNGTGLASIAFTESSGVDVPATNSEDVPNVTINVHLEYIEIVDFDESIITGSLLNYFDVSYGLDSNILLFEQNAIIPANWNGSVSFPIAVKQNSSMAESYNGFNANISASDENTNAQGNASVFTYTSSDAEVASASEFTFDNLTIYPIPTGNVLHIDNTKAGLLHLSFYDNRGRLVLEDKVEGSENSINVEKFASGTYYLKIYDTQQKAYNSIKFIVK